MAVDFICPECGKRTKNYMSTSGKWRWKYKGELYCSYSCYSKVFNKENKAWEKGQKQRRADSK